MLWSGDLEEDILIGWRDFEKRWKLGEAAGDSGAREESRETLVRRGPAGRRTDDWGEEPFLGEATPPLEEEEVVVVVVEEALLGLDALEASCDTLASRGAAGFR